MKGNLIVNKKVILILLSGLITLQINAQVMWEHLSSKNGDLEVPNQGNEQTSSAIGDFDNDGINDFCIYTKELMPRPWSGTGGC